MRRFVLATAAFVLLTAPQAAFAIMSPSALQGAQSVVPEPTAAILFAAGLGVSAWALRRRANPS